MSRRTVSVVSQPERDMDERVSLPEDVEATLKAMLAVDPDDEREHVERVEERP